MSVNEYRLKKGLNQTEFAELIGVSRVTVSNLERGIYMPSLPLAFKISAVLGATIEEIFGTK